MALPRLLLTGATGFVGSQIHAHLPAGFEVHCVSRDERTTPGAIWHPADLRDAATCRQLVEDVRPTHLVHAAWNTTHGQFWDAFDNEAWLDASRSLFAAFAETGGRRIVACGSCAEYAGSHDAALAENEDRGTPMTLYGRSKLSLLQDLRRQSVAFAWVRIFNAYGPGENARRLVPSIVLSLLRGEVAQCSSGRQRRDFIDVRELGRAIALLVSAEVQGVINLGQGEETSVGRVALRLGELVGRPDLVKLGALPDREGEPPRLVPDLRRQTDELRFAPRIGLDEGLADAIAFWRRNPRSGVRSSPNA